MATQIKIGLFVMAIGMVLVGVLAVRRTDGARDEFRFDAAKLKDRTSWIQVNNEPYHMAPVVAAACAPVTAELASQTKRDPPTSLCTSTTPPVMQCLPNNRSGSRRGR